MATFTSNVLASKTAIISGGSSGINLEIASTFVERGAKVAVFGRDAQKSKSAAQQISDALGVSAGTVKGYSADVRDFDGVQNVVEQVASDLGSIDIVIAGAAGNFPAPALKISPGGFKAVVEIDLMGTFHLFRAAFDAKSKSDTSFIAISAEQASVPHPLQAHVCAAKAGVNMLVKVLAMEWAEANVRVNAIVPGPIDDTEGMARLAPTPEARKALEDRIPLRRYGLKREVADMATFLCSDAAAYVNGAIIECDGGAHLAGLAASHRGCSKLD